MYRVCGLVRMVAQVPRAAAAVDLASPRSFSSAAPRHRGRTPRSARPSTADEWHRLPLAVDVRALTPAIPPLVRRDRAFRRPELLPVKNKGAFTHPSLLSYELRQPQQEGAQRRQIKTYERSDIFGRALIEYAIKELLIDEVPSISAQALEPATRRLMRTDVLSELAVSYGLVSRLQADPVALDTIAADQNVQASLFCSYVASAKVEHGMDVARTWVRRCFRSILTNEYPTWRAADEALVRPEAPDTPLYNLHEHCKKRDIEPRWTISSKGGVGEKVFKAEVNVGGASAAGSGRTVKLAKHNAAAIVLRDIGPSPEAGPEAEPKIAYSKLLKAYTVAHNLPAPVFDTVLVHHPVYEARIVFEGRKYVERGHGARQARHMASKAVFEGIGVDPASLAQEHEAATTGQEGRGKDGGAGAAQLRSR